MPRQGFGLRAKIDRSKLAPQLTLAPEMLPADLTLTTIEDHSSPRPGIADVVFQRAQKASQVNGYAP